MADNSELITTRVEEGGGGRLSAGDVAPDFVLPDADGNSIALSSYRGRRVVVYFYPAAATPGCTTQAQDFRDALHDFEGAGLAVLGVSPDEPAALVEFRDAERVTFPLLSDAARSTLVAYGAYGEKSMYGKTTQGVIRSTVVVDGHGVVERAYYNVQAKGHVDKLKRDLSL